MTTLPLDLWEVYESGDVRTLMNKYNHTIRPKQNNSDTDSKTLSLSFFAPVFRFMMSFEMIFFPFLIVPYDKFNVDLFSF